jgi:ATP-dependent DNA ligase
MYAQLDEVGIEGLVCKALDSRYDPRDTGSWVKVRHAETVDALVVGVVGSPDRPTAVVVNLSGRRVVTTPRLDSVQRQAVVHAIAGRVGAAQSTPEFDTRVYPVVDGPLAEVRVGTGRHCAVRFVRIRAPE